MAAANVLQLPVERKKCTESEIIQEKSHLADPNLAHHSTEKNNRREKKKKKKVDVSSVSIWFIPMDRK